MKERIMKHHRSASPKPSTPVVPTHDDIARCAYDLYDKRSRQEGQCEQNWLQAERDLRDKATTDAQQAGK